jgi:hypothetical protein
MNPEKKIIYRKGIDEKQTQKDEKFKITPLAAGFYFRVGCM